MSVLAPVVCALDLAPESEPALVAAAELAARTDLPLHLVTVRPPAGPDAFRSATDPEAAVRAVVEVTVDRALGAGACAEIAPTIAVARDRDAASAIVAYARRVDAGTLVLGTHGRRGLDRFRLGSVAEAVLRAAPCPVLVVPNGSAARAPGPAHPVLYATDLSLASTAALPAARALAALYDASLEAVSVRDPLDTAPVGALAVASVGGLADPVPLTLTAAGLRAILDDADLARVHVPSGDPADEIVRLAEARSAGAVVMGTHGRRGVAKVLMGSVAADVLRRVPCPVLVVHA